jgi:TonB-dependent receptor
MLTRVFCVLSAVLTLAFFSLFANAQAGHGTITGHVVDSGGAVLPGAHIELQPSGLTASSNGQGDFTLTNVAPGDYTATVTYVGFATFTKSITVRAGQTARADASLKVASANEEITVTSERGHGEVAALNVQRESDNILQVLPVEVITSLPNTNIADAVGRLPSVTLERDEGEGKYIQVRGAEPRYNNVTINGIEVPAPESGVRQIKLDVVPANLIDSVELNKTLSANQDGDAIGGSVNLVTKTAEERPTLYINGIGGYTPIIGGRSLEEVDSTIGQRFGTRKRLGILFGVSYDWNGRGINDVEPVPTVIPCGGGCANPNATAPFLPTYSTEDYRDYRYNRTRFGYTGSIDYKLGEVSGVYLRLLYSHFDNFGDRWVYTPSVNATSDPAGNPLTTGWLTPTLTDTNASMSYNAQARRPVEVIGSLEGGGKHEVSPKWLLIWEAAVSRSAAEDHGYSSASFNNPNSYQFAIDLSDHHIPRFFTNNANVFDLSQYSLGQFDVGQTYSPQLNLEGGVTVSKNYTAGGHFGTLEFGGKFRNAHKFEDALDPVYSANNTVLASSLLGSFNNPTYYDGAFSGAYTANQVDYGKLIASFHGNPSGFSVDQAGSVLNTYSSDFDIVERIGAGYAMNTLQFGRVRIQTGLRLEGTTENLYAYNVGGGQPLAGGGNAPATFTPISRYSSYVDPLPSAQVRFGLGKDSDIRVSYGRGIARPNYGDLPPSFGVNGIIPGVPGQVIGYGNPDLKPTHSNNFDVLFEQYLKPFGIIEGGFFFKDISDPIYEGVKSLITSATALQNPLLNPYVNDILSAPINGKNARLYGVEISYQQHLTFLPGFLNGFGLSANYGYTKSSTVGVPLRTDTPALQRQASSTANFSPTYDKGRLSARLGVSYNGPYIFFYAFQNLQADPNSASGVSPVQVPFGKNGPFGDTYLYQHTQVDAQASFRMYKGLQFIFAGLNLTNEVFGFYNGSPQYPIQREYYKPSYEFGLRYTLSGENK